MVESLSVLEYRSMLDVQHNKYNVLCTLLEVYNVTNDSSAESAVT